MGVTIKEHTDTQPLNKQSDFTVTLTGPTETYTFATTLTSHPGVARDWLHKTLHQNRSHRHNLIIGLGVQWTPYQHSPAATIQLCINKHCLIFHLSNSHSSPRILRRLLADPRNTFVGLWNFHDAAKLLHSQHQLEMLTGMPIDLRCHVEDECGRSMRGKAIAEIAEEVLWVCVERSNDVSRSDWEVQELSFEQVELASVDAFVSFVVGVRVRAWELNPNF